MFDLGKCILVANNDRAAEKQGENVEQVVMAETCEEVLLKTKNLIHTDHKLLTHPQASSLKPNQTPYGAILLYSETGKGDAGDIRLIEKTVEAFNKWTIIKKAPKYDERIAYDYKTIDLSMIENVIPKLQG